MASAQSTPDPEMRARVIYWELVGEGDAHLFWQGAALELEHARSIYKHFEKSIAPEARPPEQVDVALAALEALLLASIHHESLATTDANPGSATSISTSLQTW